MKTCLFLLFVATILIPSSPARSEETFPIVSANGFSCSNNDDLITCRGSFPGNPSPILEATGYKVVWIRGEYPTYRYTFFSDSGCLCRAEFKEGGDVKSQECTARFGETKTFKGGKSTFDWCKKK
jgi:hypothetical protein